MTSPPDEPAPPTPPDDQPSSLRLLVVDADRRVRASLADLLALADQVEVVGSASHARAAFDECEACRPDAVVVDPRLPELPDGIAFVRGLRKDRPEVRVVVIAWSPALDDIFRDDPGISVVAPEGGDLADRIVDALRVSGPAEDEPGPDARLGPRA